MSENISFNLGEVSGSMCWSFTGQNQIHNPEVKVVWSTMVKTQPSMKHEAKKHSLDIKLRTYTHSRVGKTSQ